MFVLAVGGADHSAIAAEGSVSIEVADAPTSNDDPRSGHYIVDQVVPGATLEREVRVTNAGDAATTVDLSVGGMRIIDNAIVFVDAADGDQGALETWANLPRRRLELGPHESVIADIAVIVPAEADAGEHYGVVWGARRDGDVVNRVGVRMYVAVSDGDPLPTSFSLDLVALSRERADITITNTGSRAIEPTGSVTVDGAQAQLEPGWTLLPGDSAELGASFDPDELRSQDRARVEVSLSANGVDHREAALAPLPTATDARGRPVELVPDRPSRALQAAVGGSAVVASLLVLAAFRRRADREDDEG